MNEPVGNKILFVSQNLEESKEAEALFQAEATKSELTWTALSGEFSAVQQLQKSVNLIVLLEHIDVPHMVLTNNAITTEHWRVESPTTIKQNISNLIVRLILKGGKRQPNAQTSGNAAITNVSKAAAQAAVRVSLESKGRGGKKVTVISGVPLSDSELDELTTKLKRSCGTGGTLKDGQIEIQGDHRDKLITELQKLGYKPKRKGG